MSVRDDEYWAFSTRPSDEERWSSCEELFKAHGYNLRPRLRKGWTPSWLTTGKSPLDSEDGEVLRVLSYQIVRLYADKVIDPPR
jgi:hypothetical protein